MKYLLKKDKVRRTLFKQAEIKQLFHKIGFFDSRFSFNLRGVFYLSLSGFAKDSYYVRIKNRCVLTNKGNAVSRVFHMSRLPLRYYSGTQTLSGVSKGSW